MRKFIRLEHGVEQRLGRAVEWLDRVVELLEVVVHHVEVPRLVERLARRRHFCLQRHESVGELRRDLPSREFTPEDDGEHLLERLALLHRAV